MNRNKEYAGVEYFKLIAAFLVIAIHTSPLATYSETGDFVLTRIIARVAVPFYFMVSGYFLISRYAYNTDKLKSFLKKMVVIYGISIFLYIPVNVYNHYFSMEYLLPNLLKDIFFVSSVVLAGIYAGGCNCMVFGKKSGILQSFVVNRTFIFCWYVWRQLLWADKWYFRSGKSLPFFVRVV